MEILTIFERIIIRSSIFIILGIYLSTGENKFFCIFLILIYMIFLIYTKISKKDVLIGILILLVFFSYGIIKYNYLDNSLKNYNEQIIKVQGIVTSISKKNSEFTTIVINVKGASIGKIQLKLYDYKDEMYPGMEFIVEGLFLKPSSKSNVGGYNEKKYMYSNNICGKMYIYPQNITSVNKYNFRKSLGKVYNSIKKQCISRLGAYRGNIIAGMLIGAKEEINNETIDIFRISGLSHTMAVSGSHVMYILTPLLFIFSKTQLKRRKYYPIIAIILIIFCFLTCLKPSVLRATITVLIMLFADYIYEQYDALNALALSALILICLNPLCIYDVGFILSYTCVLSILLLYKPLMSFFKTNIITSALILTLAIQIGIVLISGKIFYTVYTFSLLVNMLVLPIRMVLTILGWLMYFFSFIIEPISNILAVIVRVMLDYILIIASYFSKLKVATFSIKYISPLTLLIYYCLVIVFLYSKKIKISLILFAILILSIIVPIVLLPNFNLVFFDVGQGDSALIQINNKDIIVDCGEYASLNSISHYAGNKIDYIFITHSHSDHIGGVYSIIKRFDVNKIVIPDVMDEGFDELYKLCEKYSIEIVKTSYKDEFIIDQLKISIINPIYDNYENINNSSIVFIASYKELDILYTGDCEKEVEQLILEKNININCEILKIAHHGSNTSSTSEFINNVQPEISIISVGYNKFNHPSKKTLEKLKRYYRTDQFGAIIIKYKKNRMYIETVK